MGVVIYKLVQSSLLFPNPGCGPELLCLCVTCIQVYQRRLEVDRVLQQCQIEDQLLELAQGEHQLKEMRDEIDSRDARIERLQKDLEKYKLRMQVAVKGGYK